MTIALQEMQAIASEIYLALGPTFHYSAYAIAANATWWDHLEKPRDPNTCESGDAYFKYAIASGLFKKYEDFPGSADARKAAALQTWHKAEKQCFRTNQRFDDYIRGGDRYDALPPTVKEFLLDLKKDIAFVLGRVPNELDCSRFGPGTTYDLRGIYWSSIPSKISVAPTMTHGAWPHLRSWSKTMWGRYHSGDIFVPDIVHPYLLGTGIRLLGPRCNMQLPVVSGNRYETVPKNKETDRSIGIEPSLNLYYQLGVGDVLKRRLRHLNLLQVPTYRGLVQVTRDSQEIHRELARLSSVTGENATIDLSAASDTIAFSVVEFLLPPRWFELLSSLRSPSTEIDGDWYRLEKFSSMGNGYTFELETLIFACVCRTVLRYLSLSPKRVSVFGDDIIVPTESYRSITAALRFMGFNINAAKSFHAGPFRESCGGDYYDGVDVRPPSITGDPIDPIDWVVVHNQLYRLKGRVDDYHLNNALRVCVRNIPTQFRCYGPRRYGDAVLHSVPGKWDTKMHRFKDSFGTKGSPVLAVRALIPQAQKLPWARWDERVAVCSGVYGLPSSDVSLRGERNKPKGFRTGWLPIFGLTPEC